MYKGYTCTMMGSRTILGRPARATAVSATKSPMELAQASTCGREGGEEQPCQHTHSTGRTQHTAHSTQHTSHSTQDSFLPPPLPALLLGTNSFEPLAPHNMGDLPFLVHIEVPEEEIK